MAVFDIVHMTEPGVKQAIRKHFYANGGVKDERVIDKLLETGYYDLEDTMLQHKQKNHLMLLLEGATNTDFNSKRLSAHATEDEQFQRAISS
jgi:NADH dehydrogenase (ubiquinone) 1 alpha subcomplex subunit 6